jgi:hypothetical protein
MSFWATNMITIVIEAGYEKFWFGLVQFGMTLPIVWGFYCIGLIAETCSMLIALSDLNLSVVRK